MNLEVFSYVVLIAEKLLSPVAALVWKVEIVPDSLVPRNGMVMLNLSFAHELEVSSSSNETYGMNLEVCSYVVLIAEKLLSSVAAPVWKVEIVPDCLVLRTGMVMLDLSFAHELEASSSSNETYGMNLEVFSYVVLIAEKLLSPVAAPVWKVEIVPDSLVLRTGMVMLDLLFAHELEVSSSSNETYGLNLEVVSYVVLIAEKLFSSVAALVWKVEIAPDSFALRLGMVTLDLSSAHELETSSFSNETCTFLVLSKVSLARLCSSSESDSLSSLVLI